MPSPLLFQFFVQEGDSPTGLFPDLVEDGQDLVLFAARDEAFGCNSEGADGDGGDATVFHVGDDAAEVVGVGGLQFVHFGGGDGEDGVDAGEEAHGGVVEEAGDNCGALDQPGDVNTNSGTSNDGVSTRLRERPIWCLSGRGKGSP